MVEELLSRLENLRDKEVSLVELDGIFGEYDWDCMGFSVKPKMKKQTDKFEKLIYIECPMGKELDLTVELPEGETIETTDVVIIKNINKKYWES